MSEEDEIVKAMEAGELAGGFGPARRIETHLSQVFLAKDRAIKLKRRVKLPFADFRSLESRRRTLEEELLINRRTANDLYLEVKPIIRSAGGFALGGDGPPVDFVLIMRRFADGALFDTMAREGRLGIELIEETALRIAAFHAGLPVSQSQVGADYYAGIIEELEQTATDGAIRHCAEPLPGDLFRALRRKLLEIGGLIDLRMRAGHVRRGHGDLHLRNICLYGGTPTLFDALEFDAALATHDTLYDFAFLLMDLRHRGLKHHANVAMNCYWDKMQEREEALGLLAFFMALRAGVRMAVLAEAGDFAEAKSYMALGLALLRPVERRLVAIGGLSGTGKSALARRLAPELQGPCGARLIRSDVVRKRLSGIETETHLAPSAYTHEERMKVYGVLARRAAAALGSCSVIADATFREAETRAMIEGAAAGQEFTGLWLAAPAAIRVERVGARSHDASDADRSVAAAQTEPHDLSAAWRRIDASGTIEDVVQAARRALGLD